MVLLPRMPSRLNTKNIKIQTINKTPDASEWHRLNNGMVASLAWGDGS